MDKLPKKSLIKADREALNEILEKEAGELVDEEIATIKARVNYLNSDERKRFASVLSTAQKVVADKPIEKMNRAELEAKAASLNIDSSLLEGKTNKEVVAIIVDNQ